MRKLFDSEPKKRKRKSKRLKPIKTPPRYRYTYDELYNLPDDKLAWFESNGYPEEQDKARGIRAERKRMRLLTYGY
jgi:hypothetical protein